MYQRGLEVKILMLIPLHGMNVRYYFRMTLLLISQSEKCQQCHKCQLYCQVKKMQLELYLQEMLRLYSNV